MQQVRLLIAFLVLHWASDRSSSQAVNLKNQSPNRFQIFSATDPLVGAASRLGKPLIGEDGMVYSCSGSNLFAFGGNGSISWTVHLHSTCNAGIPPVYGGWRIIYLVAANRVLKVNFRTIVAPEPNVEVVFNPDSVGHRISEIVGLSSSAVASSIYINIKNQGIFAYSYGGTPQWSTGPVFKQLGYLQSCRKNVHDCHFTSAMEIDQCEASIYISNNQGELYSLSIHHPRLKWIQDFNLFNERLTVTQGNNGMLYVTVPSKYVVFALDAFNGDILWQKSIGPLSSASYKPVVDSNGWISVGSLDGFLYSFSPTGTLKKFTKSSSTDSVIQVGPVLDCSGYAVYISQAEMEGKRSIMAGECNFVSAVKPKNVVFTLLVPATGSVFWFQTYPGHFSLNLTGSDLRNFILDEEIILAFIAASNAGNPLSCRSTGLRIAVSCSEVRSKSLTIYTGDERTILLFLTFETAIVAALAIIVRFCWLFWGKKKLQDKGLGPFLEKRRSLRLMKKELNQTIKELERNATEQSATPDVLDKLSGVVREREGIDRKLLTTYSLGRDSSLREAPSKLILPLYNDKAKSYSFQGRSRKENVTIFHSYSDDSSAYERSSEEEDKEDKKSKYKGKKPFESDSSADDNDIGYDPYDYGVKSGFYGTSSVPDSRARYETDKSPLVHKPVNWKGRMRSDDDKNVVARSKQSGEVVRRRTESWRK